jgi:hypothetical protein
MLSSFNSWIRFDAVICFAAFPHVVSRNSNKSLETLMNLRRTVKTTDRNSLVACKSYRTEQVY